MFQYFETMTDEPENENLGGRPSKYSPELRNKICARLATGESLRSICRDEDMPNRSTVHSWVIENIGEIKDGDTVIEAGFSDHYTRARDLGLDEMADDLLEISDDGTNDWMEKTINKGKSNEETIEVLNKEAVMRSRLRVDTRKWYLSKMAPKRYGDSRKIEHQQLDAEGNTTDPVGTNTHAQEIADAVDREMEKVMKALENGNTEESA